MGYRKWCAKSKVGEHSWIGTQGGYELCVNGCDSRRQPGERPDGSLPTPAEARAKGEEGGEAALAKAGVEWQAYAREYVHDFCERTPPEQDWLPEELWEDGLEVWPPMDKRAIGPIIKAAARVGWLEWSGKQKKARSSNWSLKPTRRSKIYRGDR